MFFIPNNKTEEERLLDKLYPVEDLDLKSLKDIRKIFIKDIVDTKKQENLLKNINSDELNPTMGELLKKRSFNNKNFDAIFENMKRPQNYSKDLVHSTFGRDVIYIYHSHSRESFLPYFNSTKNPEEAYHSTANITIVGELLGKSLEKRGVGTKVDSIDVVEELYLRGLNFNNSYEVSRERVQSARAKNKDLEIFLDIHRDSLRRNSTTKKFNGVNFARLLFIVGTGHKKFEENLHFTEGLNKQLSIRYPGLSRGIITKDSSQGNGVYNQDISPNAVIIEIGGVDNTLEELNLTVEALAEVLSNYYWHRKE